MSWLVISATGQKVMQKEYNYLLSEQLIFITNSNKKWAWLIIQAELVKWTQPLSTPSELFTWSGIRPECEINGNSSLLARLGLALGDWELGQQAGHGVAVRDESELWTGDWRGSMILVLIEDRPPCPLRVQRLRPGYHGLDSWMTRNIFAW